MEITRDEALARYRLKFGSLAPITDEQFKLLADLMLEKRFSRGEVILREGQVCRHFYFILQGCIRSFNLKEGREVNVNFYFEDDTACDFASFREERPSDFYLVAMEDCVVFYTSKVEALPVFTQEPAFHMLLFRFFQQLFLREEEHSNTFKLLSPKERYCYVLEHQPKYLQRIPMVYLASYLGISRETLTRIRREAC